MSKSKTTEMDLRELLRKLPDEKKCIITNIPIDSRNIIDMGCGTGFFAYCISEMFPTAQVTAIDGDVQYVEEALQQYRNPNLHFYHYNFTNLHLASRFDVVIFSEVIEHLPNVGTNLDMINSLSVEDGTLFVSTDNAFFGEFLLANIYYSLTKRRPSFYLWHQQDRYYDWNHHIYSWTLSTLSTLMKLYGYDLQRYWFTNHSHISTLKDMTFDAIGMLFPAFRRKIVLELKRTSEPMRQTISQDPKTSSGRS
jgi:SAM-dependent methyltransferase